MPDLFPLFKLHQVDAAMVDIKKRHDHMDPGRAIAAELQAATRAYEEARAEAERLAGELKDAELNQKSIEDKRQKFDKQLYGGQVVNPREVEAIQKEIEMLKNQRDGLDERILELWELLPPAQERERARRAAVEDLKSKLTAHQEHVIAERARLAAEYKTLAAQRPKLLDGIDPGLLSQYEATRKKYGGIGMAEVTNAGTCGQCGTSLPRRAVLAASEDKITLCESCHRILYKAAHAT